jgi:hypothetical protein
LLGDRRFAVSEGQSAALAPAHAYLHLACSQHPCACTARWGCCRIRRCICDRLARVPAARQRRANGIWLRNHSSSQKLAGDAAQRSTSTAQHSTQQSASAVCRLPSAPRAAAASPAGAAAPGGICETPVCRLCRHCLYPASIHENSMKPSFALRPNSHNSLQPCHWPIDVRYLSPVSQGYRTPARYRRQNAPLAASSDADHPPESLRRCELHTSTSSFWRLLPLPTASPVSARDVVRHRTISIALAPRCKNVAARRHWPAARVLNQAWPPHCLIGHAREARHLYSCTKADVAGASWALHGPFAHYVLLSYTFSGAIKPE